MKSLLIAIIRSLNPLLPSLLFLYLSLFIIQRRSPQGCEWPGCRTGRLPHHLRSFSSTSWLLPSWGRSWCRCSKHTDSIFGGPWHPSEINDQSRFGSYGGEHILLGELSDFLDGSPGLALETHFVKSLAEVDGVVSCDGLQLLLKFSHYDLRYKVKIC